MYYKFRHDEYIHFIIEAKSHVYSRLGYHLRCITLLSTVYIENMIFAYEILGLSGQFQIEKTWVTLTFQEGPYVWTCHVGISKLRDIGLGAWFSILNHFAYQGFSMGFGVQLILVTFSYTMKGLNGLPSVNIDIFTVKPEGKWGLL